MNFKLWCCTNKAIPLVFDNSLSYYERLCKVASYINNLSSDVVEIAEMQKKLQDYVDNYFTNLDVQQEINNKLDEMVENGDLQNIIGQYINENVNFIYENVEEMISNTLESGKKIKTLGYYEINDGGGAYYYVTEKNNEVNDGFHIINNNLCFNLIIENNQVNILSLGAKKTNSTLTKNDIKNYIQFYLNYNENILDKLKLYIPSGGYYCSEIEIVSEKGFSIIGDKNFTTEYLGGTVISSFNDNQDYIFKIGNTSKQTYNWNIENITFTSANFNISENNLIYIDKNNVKNLTYALKFMYAQTGSAKDLYFQKIIGKAIGISSCWENNFENINFRYIWNFNDNGILTFEPVNTSLSQYANITANYFRNLHFESTFGHLIYFTQNCGFVNNEITNIFFEDSPISLNNTTITSTLFTPENLPSFNDETANHFGIFAGNWFTCAIGDILLNNVPTRYYNYNGNTYVYDTVFNCNENGSGPNCSVNSITIDIANKPLKIMLLKDNVNERATTDFKISKIINNTQQLPLYDVQGIFPITSCKLSKYKTLSKEIGNEFTPFNEIITRFGGDAKGILFYDENSLNNLRLSANPFPANFQNYCCQFVCGSKNLKIRAKIPNGEIAKLNFETSATSEIKELTGTGDFNFYDITFTNIDIGDLIGLKFTSDSQTKNCLLDIYKFI